MTPPLSPARLLDAAERGVRLHPLDRALAVLRLAEPELDEDPAELPIAERDRRLLELRRATFGERMECVVECPECGDAQEFELSAGDLLAAVGTAAPPETIRRDGWTLALRPLDSRDLAAVAGAADGERAAAKLAERAIAVVGRPPRAAASTPIPRRLRSAAERRVEEREAAADLALRLRCTGCGAAWTAAFDIGAHFWLEIDARAHRLIDEVAALAGRFGWSEADLLAMPASRRRAYLEAGRLA